MSDGIVVTDVAVGRVGLERFFVLRQRLRTLGLLAARGITVRIRKLTVQNFRALRNVEIRPVDYTVLVGGNASGKSSIVHALRLLFDVDARHLVSDLTEEDINHEALQAGTVALVVAVC